MKERSRGTPLIDMLKGYQPCRGRFHMPGHKASPDFCRTFPGAAWDITELPFSDDLLDEKGCIAEAEELAAAAFCGEFCLFLTGGTTLAVQIMVGMAARRGPLLLPRASHRSAFAACELFGAEPVVLEAEECTAEGVQKKAGKAAALLVTAPDYEGRMGEAPAMLRAARACGLLALCDQAHGAHLGFCDRLPAGAAGIADLWAVSAHKTLPALNQASLLLGRAAWAEEAREFRKLLHTTSPSYPILASLDYARDFMEREGEIRLAALLRWREREQPFWPLRPEQNEDFTKLRFDLTPYGLEEAEVRRYFSQAGLTPEILSGEEVLFLLSVCDGEEDLNRLSVALRGFGPFRKVREALPPPSGRPEKAFAFLDRDFGREFVPLADCEGRAAACNVGLYPPGRPVLLRGERFDRPRMEYLLRNAGRLFGGTPEAVPVRRED